MAISGIFCSLSCARYDNRFVVRGHRTPQGWEDRERAMLAKYLKEEEGEKNIFSLGSKHVVFD